MYGIKLIDFTKSNIPQKENLELKVYSDFDNIFYRQHYYSVRILTWRVKSEDRPNKVKDHSVDHDCPSALH